jgi:hypothetical protein
MFMKTSIFCDITPCALLKLTVTEQYVTSIFRVEEKAIQDAEQSMEKA